MNTDTCVFNISYISPCCVSAGDPSVPWKPKPACMKHLTSNRERYDKSVSPETIYNLLPKITARPRIWYVLLQYIYIYIYMYIYINVVYIRTYFIYKILFATLSLPRFPQ